MLNDQKRVCICTSSLFWIATIINNPKIISIIIDLIFIELPQKENLFDGTKNKQLFFLNLFIGDLWKVNKGNPDILNFVSLQLFKCLERMIKEYFQKVVFKTKKLLFLRAF